MADIDEDVFTNKSSLIVFAIVIIISIAIILIEYYLLGTKNIITLLTVTANILALASLTSTIYYLRHHMIKHHNVCECKCT